MKGKAKATHQTLEEPVLEVKPGLIVKANSLVEASYSLNVIEHKMIRYVASLIKRDDQDFKTYTISVKEFAKAIGVNHQGIYEDLQKVTMQILKKPMQFMTEKGRVQVPWFSYILYNEGGGTIDIRFDSFWKPYLLNLKERFTRYQFENVARLRSNYSIRIYELMKQYEAIGHREFTVEKLRTILGAEDIYPLYGDFKRRVILTAQKELQQKTDIRFEFDEIKLGRSVHKLKFHIFAVREEKENQQQLDLFETLSQSENPFVQCVRSESESLKWNWTDDEIMTLEAYGIDVVVAAIEQIKKQRKKKIFSPIAYLQTVIEGIIKEVDGMKEQVAVTSEKIRELQLPRILQAISDRFVRDRGPVPDFLVKDFAIQQFTQELEVTKEEAQELWELYGTSVMNEIKHKRTK